MGSPNRGGLHPARTRKETMSEIKNAFEAGYRAYREAFDHYDDPDEQVEHSLEWRTAEYVAAQHSVQADASPCSSDTGEHYYLTEEVCVFCHVRR